MDYLKFTPLEHVPLDTEREPRDLDSSDMLSTLRYWSKTRSDWVSILKCEQKWIKKLNKHRDLPQPMYHLQFKICG